ncbi:MAG: glycogen debranching protein [Frankiaceae bacterium]
MARRHAWAAAVTMVVAITTAVPGLATGTAAGATAVTAAGPLDRLSPTLSVTDRLGDRRYVAAGERAYDIGTEAGRYPAMGWHILGEMGGIWSPPIKLLDGLWFGIDGAWLGPATRFSSGYGYVRMRLPGPAGLGVTRTDFVPDGRRAVLVGLTLTTGDAARQVSLTMDAHSELMSAYPWGSTTPSQSQFNLPDRASFDGKRLVFRETGTPPVPNAAAHDWAALVGSPYAPTTHRTGSGFRGPQDPPVICPVSGDVPPLCDDSGFGKGAGGELGYRLSLPARTSTTVWFTVAGSDHGLAAARAEYAAASKAPMTELDRKVSQRLELAQRSRVSLPDDPRLAQSLEWAKQNLADLTQSATDVRVRPTGTGTSYPAPLGTVPRIRFAGAGFPDYPWLFATDGEYTAFALVAAGQAGVVEDHLRALRSISLIANHGSGKVVHEVVTDGSVYFGLDADPGDVDETAKFPSTVALVWRWTGDNAFRDEMYGFARKNLQYLLAKDDADHDLWPEGSGNVEATGLGAEKLDVAVYTIRGLLDLAEMAASKGDSATRSWALGKARSMLSRFGSAWWMPGIPQHADSLENPGNVKTQQRWWIGVTPMEAELHENGHAVPGVAAISRANAALRLRQTSCYSGAFGLYVQGGAGCDPAPPPASDNRSAFSLNTAVMAVGEGNYGRMGLDQQQRYTTANARLMLRPDEQPGALPEIAPSPAFTRNIDQPFTSRSMVMQAWGSYGLLWPVVHQQLGVRPDLGVGRLEVVPQVPSRQSSIAGSDIRVGRGFVDVAATHVGSVCTTTVSAVVGARLVIGHRLPLSATVRSVTLNGQPAAYRIRRGHRGQEVLVAAPTGSRQRLVVTTG